MKPAAPVTKMVICGRYPRTGVLARVGGRQHKTAFRPNHANSSDSRSHYCRAESFKNALNCREYFELTGLCTLCVDRLCCGWAVEEGSARRGACAGARQRRKVRSETPSISAASAWLDSRAAVSSHNSSRLVSPSPGLSRFVRRVGRGAGAVRRLQTLRGLEAFQNRTDHLVHGPDISCVTDTRMP